MRLARLAASLLLGGCVSNVTPVLRPLEIPTAPYEGVVTTAATGSLMYEGNCLLFRGDATRLQLVPVWPDGSSFDGTAVTFHVPGRADQRIVVAEEIQLAGRPIQSSGQPGSRVALYERHCPGQPFAVLRIHPAN